MQITLPWNEEGLPPTMVSPLLYTMLLWSYATRDASQHIDFFLLVEGREEGDIADTVSRTSKGREEKKGRESC